MAGPAAADAQGSVGNEYTANGDHASPFAAVVAQDAVPSQATAEQRRSAALQAPAERQPSSDSGRGGGEPSSGQHQVPGHELPVPASAAAGRTMAAGSPGAGHISARRGQVCCLPNPCSARCAAAALRICIGSPSGATAGELLRGPCWASHWWLQPWVPSPFSRPQLQCAEIVTYLSTSPVQLWELCHKWPPALQHNLCHRWSPALQHHPRASPDRLLPPSSALAATPGLRHLRRVASPAHRIIAVRAGSAELDREGVAGLSPTGTSVMGEIEAAAASVYEDEQEGNDLAPTGSLGQRVWASCGRKLRRWGGWQCALLLVLAAGAGLQAPCRLLTWGDQCDRCLRGGGC